MKEWEDCPKTLDEAMDELIRHHGKDPVMEEEFKKWLDLPEDEAIAMSHHGFGTGIRNMWGLWHGSPLAKWFWENHKIAHADDMSGIIITSLHRRCNHKPIDVAGQVEKYHRYWTKDGKSQIHCQHRGGNTGNKYKLAQIKMEDWKLF